MSSTPRRTSIKIQALAKRLRRNQTQAERLLWKVLRNRQVHDLKWRRQYPIGNYIVDFYCAQHRIILELDGDAHMDRKEYDDRRTEWLRNKGYYVLRFSNRDVINDISGVVDRIIDVANKVEA